MDDMSGRIAWLAILAGLSGCTRTNAAYDDSQSLATSSDSASSTRGSGATDGATKGSTSLATGATFGPSSSSTLPTDPSVASSMGPSSDSGLDTTTSEIETGEGLRSLLWITPPVTGDWGDADNDLCAVALLETGAACGSRPVVVVGTVDVPIVELPDLFDFLEGPFFAATTGEFILESLEDFVKGPVEAEFVPALTVPDPAPDLFVWRGPVVADGSVNCNDWSSPSGTGTLFLFEAGSGAVSFNSNAPCRSNVRLLCSCAGTR